MRKQTKLVAVLSAAALLAVGASMTSFAGWEKDEDGIWHYYDSDDEMVTDEWRKDGSKWFYLDEDGNMLTDSWVDDEYYVGSDGAMLKNQWVKTTADEDVDDPEDDGEMRYGWHQDGEDVFYLGGEDEGWRAESQWLWLALPDEDEVDRNGVDFDSDECEDCDEEGWYYFGSNGKMYQKADKKKVNGKYYFFNEHGQMVYEWINNQKYVVSKNTTPSGAELETNASASNALDGNAVADGEEGAGYIYNMQYSNVVEDGSRANGWYEIDGSSDTGTDGDTDWYYFDDGEPERADSSRDLLDIADGDGAPVYRAKIKIDGKYFCFNEMGQMQTGLQYIPKDKAFYYFDDNGYMQTGKESNVEDDDDSFNYYFITKNGKNGQGQKGEKDGYLYFEGKRIEADDDYRVVYYEGAYYLVNNKGKIQDSKSKKYDVENGNGLTDVQFTFSGNKITGIVEIDGEKATDEDWADLREAATIPYVSLYDGYFTYEIETEGSGNSADIPGTGLKWFTADKAPSWVD